MGDYKLLNGSIFDLYLGDVGATAPTIPAATGAITPDPATWALVGGGRFPGDVTVNNQDVRQDIMTAAGRGMPDGERRTLRGVLITGGLWDASQESFAEAWGNAITETAAGSGQVGIKQQNFDLDLNVDDHGVLIVTTSRYGAGTDDWQGLIYLPAATFMLGEMTTSPTAAPTPFTIKQVRNASAGYWSEVFADAT